MEVIIIVIIIVISLVAQLYLVNMVYLGTNLYID